MGAGIAPEALREARTAGIEITAGAAFTAFTAFRTAGGCESASNFDPGMNLLKPFNLSGRYWHDLG